MRFLAIFSRLVGHRTQALKLEDLPVAERRLHDCVDELLRAEDAREGYGLLVLGETGDASTRHLELSELALDRRDHRRRVYLEGREDEIA